MPQITESGSVMQRGHYENSLNHHIITDNKINRESTYYDFVLVLSSNLCLGIAMVLFPTYKVSPIEIM